MSAPIQWVRSTTVTRDSREAVDLRSHERVMEMFPTKEHARKVREKLMTMTLEGEL